MSNFLKTAATCFAVSVFAATSVTSATVEETVDSLFVIASSGELKYRDSVEPAKEALAELGSAAVPRLVEKLTTPDARERLTVIRIIQKIGVSAVPHLRESLTNLDNALQLKRICWALGDLNELGVSAIPELVNVSSHSDWQVREYALRALGKVADSAVPEMRAQVANSLAVGFADSVGQVRKSAAWAVGALKIVELAPELTTTLADSFYGARMNASEALVKLGDEAFEGLLIFLSHVPDSSAAGDLACMTLGSLGDFAADTLTQRRQNELTGQLSARSALRRGVSVLALGDCADSSVLPELANLRLTERDPYVIDCIERAQERIGSRTKASASDSE